METELSSRTLERILYETVDLWNGERCLLLLLKFHVYYETIKRELNTRLINECRCDERLNGKAEGSTLLTYTGLRGELEIEVSHTLGVGN